jgi:hypothetical protein
MNRLTSVAAILAAAVAGHAQDTRRPDFLPSRVTVEAGEARVPLTFVGGRPVVEARLNGKGPFRFYFDTGASGPVLSQKLAAELGAEVLGVAGVKSGGDAPDKEPISAQVVRLDQVELGGAKLADVRVVAMDRTRLGGPDAPMGVLSPALFPGYLVSLDYPRKELTLRAGQLGSPDDKTVFAYQPDRPIPSVLADVAGQEVEMHLDSGSGAGLSLPLRFAETLPLAGKPADTGKKARSVSGDFPVLEGKLNGKLAFGQFSMEDPAVEFSDVVRRGNLGSRILDRFVVTLDVKNRRFRLEEAVRRDARTPPAGPSRRDR